MTAFIRTQAELDASIVALTAIDARFARLLELSGPPALRKREGGFEGLVRIIVGQQLSTASANAIWGRLAAAFDPFDSEVVRRARADKLGRIGLSAAKIRTVRAIGKALASGALNLHALARGSADEAHAALTAVHGIGPWTADVYLLFCLGHADAWPAGDLALQEGARLAFALSARPTSKEMIAHAERWRPWRGAAAYVLWTYYRVAKGREGAPVSSKNKGNGNGRARRPAA